MKETTVNSLVVARTLLERAEHLCLSQDRHLASAGLVILQDALETVMYALLIELGVDEEKNLERKSFDDLIAELRAANVTVPKSGTLKALNKQRVLTKHYAQVAEPATVRSYFDAALIAIETTCRSVIGKSLRELFIADILQGGESKTYLKEAESAIVERRFLDALSETRKALYVEFEEEYNIYGWRDYKTGTQEGMLGTYARGGFYSPSWTKNEDWIKRHIKIPTDFIQVDAQHWRLKAMELGIHTVEFENLQRLTPKVFRKTSKDKWVMTYDASFPACSATEENARYCLDRAVSMILKKQEHSGARRELSKSAPFDPPEIYIGRIVYESPSVESAEVHTVSDKFKYVIKRVVGGFDPDHQFYEVDAIPADQEDIGWFSLMAGWKHGFLQILDDDGI